MDELKTKIEENKKQYDFKFIKTKLSEPQNEKKYLSDNEIKM